MACKAVQLIMKLRFRCNAAVLSNTPALQVHAPAPHAQCSENQGFRGLCPRYGPDTLTLQGTCRQRSCTAPSRSVPSCWPSHVCAGVVPQLTQLGQDRTVQLRCLCPVTVCRSAGEQDSWLPLGAAGEASVSSTQGAHA